MQYESHLSESLYKVEIELLKPNILHHYLKSTEKLFLYYVSTTIFKTDFYKMVSALI